ncbi:MAG: sporulation transcriptional regulator SpoIIID [Clostridiales bacterium]|nr:sporulation transcriptional regulator SpoIIID [Clostridiales bacterium]
MKKEYFNHLVSYGDLNERVLSLAVYVIEKNATVRETAKEFGISKSTVHKDLSQRLLSINPCLFEEVRAVLDKNKAERHIRGGLATKRKYLALHLAGRDRRKI